MEIHGGLVRFLHARQARRTRGGGWRRCRGAGAAGNIQWRGT